MNEQLIIIIAILGMCIRLFAWFVWREKRTAQRNISNQRMARAEMDFIAELRFIEADRKAEPKQFER